MWRVATYMPTHHRLAQAYLHQGSLKKAQGCIAQAVRLPGASPMVQALAGYTMARTGSKPVAEDIRESLLNDIRQRYISPVSIATVCIGLDDHRAALSWLRRGVEVNDSLLVDLKIDPTFDPLRGDPQFRSLVTKLHLA